MQASGPEAKDILIICFLTITLPKTVTLITFGAFDANTEVMRMKRVIWTVGASLPIHCMWMRLIMTIICGRAPRQLMREILIPDLTTQISGPPWGPLSMIWGPMEGRLPYLKKEKQMILHRPM